MPTIPPGIQGLPHAVLPPTYDEFKHWFAQWVTQRLSNADVRNATPGFGMNITATGISGSTKAQPTAAATLSVGSPITDLFDQPYILAPGTGSSELTQYRLLDVQVGVITLADTGPLGSVTISVFPNGIGNAQLRQSAPLSVMGSPTNAAVNVSDIVASADGQALQRLAGALGFAPLALGSIAQIANDTVLGNVSGGLAVPVALTQAQLATLVGVAVGANPTAKVGLTAVDGTAATFMTSDSSPELDVTIGPTWTGEHIFNPTSGQAITVQAVDNQYGIAVTGSATSGKSYGLQVVAGTTSADFSLVVESHAAAILLAVRGDGAIGLYGATPVVQRATATTHTTTNAITSASFGATQVAILKEIMNTLIAVGIWAA